MSDAASFITFEVTVCVTPEGSWDEAMLASYARDALATADLCDAQMLDGFADRTATAYISEIS